MFQTLNKTWDTLTQMTNDTVVGKTVVLSAAAIGAFLLPIFPIIGLCFGATLVDMYYGIQVARKYKTVIQSRYMWTGTLSKLKDTFIILVMARCIEAYLLVNITTAPILVGSAALIVVFTELWSILENMNTLNPNGPWRVLKKFLRHKGSHYLQIDLAAIEKEIKDEDAKYNTKVCVEIQGVHNNGGTRPECMGNEQQDKEPKG